MAAVGDGRDASGLHVRGTIRVPGDKSISHRALILAAMASGPSRIRHILQSDDVQATAGALRALGASVPSLSADMVVHGLGVGALRSPNAPLQCQNSGTTTRLLAGLVAGLDGRAASFVGDASLSRRPMRRVAAPLRAMGAQIAFEGPEGHEGLPMRVMGARLTPLTYASPHASAQVKGAVLLAGVASGVSVTVTEPERSRDHSERMLAARGVQLRVHGTSVTVAAGQTVAPCDVDVPADPSSATFFAALAALATGGELSLTGVACNPTRTGAFDVLRRMGADVAITDIREEGGEPTGTVTVRPSALHGVRIAGADIPRCIDELPMLACVAACIDGTTEIRDAQELRVKESDRITAVVDNLRRLGVAVEEFADGMRITGARTPRVGTVVTHGDHRLAMAFGVIGALSGNAIIVDDPACVGVSYPEFWRDLAAVTGLPHPQGAQ